MGLSSNPSAVAVSIQAVVERLLPEPVAGDDQPAQRCVPQREGKHAAETCQETIKRLREGNELKDEELLKAKDEITELKRRLDDNGGPCALRVKLTAETCGQTIKRLWKDKERLREDNERLREDNERLLEASPTHQHNHTFERDNNDTQA